MASIKLCRSEKWPIFLRFGLYVLHVWAQGSVAVLSWKTTFMCKVLYISGQQSYFLSSTDISLEMISICKRKADDRNSSFYSSIFIKFLTLLFSKCSKSIAGSDISSHFVIKILELSLVQLPMLIVQFCNQV